jgi:cytohesin
MRDNRRARIWQHDLVKYMKSKFYILIVVLTGLSAQAQTSNLTSLLQQGLFEEQANRNLDAAISNYQSLATQFEKDRQLAATAVFRIGECYRMQGKANQAVAQYQRILRDFSDQAQLATLSRQNLAGLGSVASLPPAAEPISDAARKEAETLLQQEIDLFQKQLETQQQQVKAGVMNPQDLLPTQQKLIELKLQLAQPGGGQPGSGQAAAPTDEEEHEIRRIQELIQNSPDLINSGDLPLIKAARNGWLRVAAYLLDHGAEINGSQNGSTALQAAAEAGNRGMVELLLSRGADVNVNTGSSGTPLCLAAKNGFQAVVEVLLAHKADVNASTDFLSTPLDLAARHRQTKIIQMLLAAGANPNLENRDGVTALSHAAGSRDIVKMLLDAKADANGGKIDVPLIAAIYARDAASVELLLQAGANPNLKSAIDGTITLPSNSPGRRGGGGGGGGGIGSPGSVRPLTPLFLAVDTRQLPMVNLLLKYKADPNDSQTDGRPLWFSALADTNILESLLDAGAKVDANWRRENDQTPLFSAVVANNAAAVELLLKHGANPNIHTAEGYTPLTAAAERLADAKVFELLLAYKAEPNLRGYNGKTPIELLRDKARNSNFTAHDRAAAGDLADLLRQHGALDNPPNWNAITVSRASSGVSAVVFQRETNDWNRFTLLETILNYYTYPYPYIPGLNSDTAGSLPFPDLTRVTIVRPGHGTTNETRISVNLLNSTNGIDCSKNVPLEFGDVVEIPERDHSLADSPVGLTASQYDTLLNCLKAVVQLVVLDQKVELPIFPVQPGSIIGNVLDQPDAKKILSSSSDLSRVKVSRHNAKTGENQEWTVDCSHFPSSNSSPPGVNFVVGIPAEAPPSTPSFWLRDGDVINVPEKP